ncbi:MAG: hypothetical protein V2I26_08845 [Halieaceae bacterium]|nr:hypothetical protein [Halieaceae bacterium]
MTLLATLFLPGCAFLAGTPPATFATPVPSDRFPVPPEGDDIVGRVQVAIARDGDTRHQGDTLEPLKQLLAARTGDRPVEVNQERAQQVALEARGLPVAISGGGADVEMLLALAPRVASTPPWVLEDYDIEELRQLPTY